MTTSKNKTNNNVGQLESAGERSRGVDHLLHQKKKKRTDSEDKKTTKNTIAYFTVTLMTNVVISQRGSIRLIGLDYISAS